MTLGATMACRIVLAGLVFLAPACGLCQLTSIGCGDIYNPFNVCSIPQRNTLAVASTFLSTSSPVRVSNDGNRGGQESSSVSDDAPGTSPEGKDGFHWGRALTESFTFLLIEQAYVVHTDFRWVVSENGIPFNHYWRDYKQSLSEWTQSGWSDGDPNMFGYVGHPIQGALTSFIEIQNDPKSRALEFSNSKRYWK